MVRYEINGDRIELYFDGFPGYPLINEMKSNNLRWNPSKMRWWIKQWQKFRKNEPEDSDANTYRRNSYRVLLTRGRDGFIVFIPPVERLDSVYDLLLSVGIKELKYIQINWV